MLQLFDRFLVDFLDDFWMIFVKTAVFSSALRMTNTIGANLRALRLYKVHEPKQIQNSCESVAWEIET